MAKRSSQHKKVGIERHLGYCWMADSTTPREPGHRTLESCPHCSNHLLSFHLPPSQANFLKVVTDLAKRPKCALEEQGQVLGLLA